MNVVFYDENDTIIDTRNLKRVPSIGTVITINGTKYTPWYVESCRTNGTKYANVRLELA